MPRYFRQIVMFLLVLSFIFLSVVSISSSTQDETELISLDDMSQISGGCDSCEKRNGICTGTNCTAFSVGDCDGCTKDKVFIECSCDEGLIKFKGCEF